MSLYVIGVLRKDENDNIIVCNASPCEEDSTIVGYRIFDNKSMTYVDADKEHVRDKLKRHMKINGLWIEKTNSIVVSYGKAYLSSKKTDLIRWVAIGKNETGVLLVNQHGDKKLVTYELIMYGIKIVMSILNILRELTTNNPGKLTFMCEVDDMELEFNTPESILQINKKLSLLGDMGYHFDASGEIIITNKNLLKNVTIPKGVKLIRPYTFRRCSELEYIIIGSDVEEIGKEAFENCKGLKEVIIPGNVKTIGCGAFDGCSNLQRVELCDGIEKIEEAAFKNCNSLKEIKLPRTLQGKFKLSEWFNGCKITVYVPVSIMSKMIYMNDRESKNIRVKFYA